MNDLYAITIYEDGGECDAGISPKFLCPLSSYGRCDSKMCLIMRRLYQPNERELFLTTDSATYCINQFDAVKYIADNVFADKKVHLSGCISDGARAVIYGQWFYPKSVFSDGSVLDIQNGYCTVRIPFENRQFVYAMYSRGG